MSPCKRHTMVFWYHEEGINFLQCENCDRIEMESTPGIAWQ